MCAMFYLAETEMLADAPLRAVSAVCALLATALIDGARR
jgi:hypothetical protein